MAFIGVHVKQTDYNIVIVKLVGGGRDGTFFTRLAQRVFCGLKTCLLELDCLCVCAHSGGLSHGGKSWFDLKIFRF